jgi:hypothetical protein
MMSDATYGFLERPRSWPKCPSFEEVICTARRRSFLSADR